MKNEKWDLYKYKDQKLTLNKLCSKKTVYKYNKQDSISIIWSQIYCNQLNLFKEPYYSSSNVEDNKKKIDISCISKIDTIEARVINKSIIKFANVDHYCQIYMKIYDEILNWLANKKSHTKQVNYYAVFLQCAILDKHSEFYTLFIIAIDK